MLTRLWMWFLTRMGRDSRGLFLFYDGRRWRTVDAIEALRGFFLLKDFDWDSTPDLLKQPIATVQVATSKRIADAVREVLKVKSSANGGLTETECLEVFHKFRAYVDNVKKNTSLYPITTDYTDQNQSLDELEIPPNLPSAFGSMPSVKLPDAAGLPAVPTSDSTMK